MLKAVFQEMDDFCALQFGRSSVQGCCSHGVFLCVPCFFPGYMPPILQTVHTLQLILVSITLSAVKLSMPLFVFDH